ncbi:hypothetical protein CYY_008466 [Polysphondylium violaceum]|uniref:Histone RNA hairpin-binding protein RNA-binding domain-containing protein n=1 Tax=Polysphondylium violaceum TaxID=133409 RepID=A0A8J4PNC0_9MYCE|nr:hypothetical protein CYY_008466 [Polysphondylium violaceum]
MSTVLPTVPASPLVSNNGKNNNRALLKNIKNVNSTPTSALKKQQQNVTNKIGNGPSTPAPKKNVNKNILFTPSSFSCSKPKSVSFGNNGDSPIKSLLESARILSELHEMDNMDSMMMMNMNKESTGVAEQQQHIPLSFADLVSDLAVSNTDSVNKPTTPLIRYSAQFLLSVQSQFTKRPIEIDIVEDHQKEVIASQPSTPHIHNSSSKNKTLPIFSPQVSPFKIAYQTPLASRNANATPASSTRKSQNHNSAKKNPIPFNLTEKNCGASLTPIKQQQPQQQKKKLATEDLESLDVENNNNTDNNNTTIVPAAENDESVDLTASASAKKQPAREADPKRLAARQRQIDIGKMTVGYKNFIEQVPKSKRKPTDPKTPNKYQICSKRSWDGQVRKWRRLLHQYDPSSAEGKEFNDEDLEKELNALEINENENENEINNTEQVPEQQHQLDN